MKRLITLFCFISFVQLTGAQIYTHEFGKYSNEEFQLKKYAKDPSAEAVVIYDIGKSYFVHNSDVGFQLIFERKMKIKILTKAGLKWAQISIPYYEENSKNEEIEQLEGNTYNYENGQVRVAVLDPKNAYTEKFNEHWNDKKFAMPDVKEGSVFEVSYKIRSPYFFNFRNWEFQNKIPVIYSEYTTKMIPFYEYTYILQGSNKFDDFKTYQVNSPSSPVAGIEYQDVVYYFVMKDIPAFKDEAYITSANDYIIKLDFQLSAIHYPTGGNVNIMTTWKELSKEMLDNESFGKYLKSSRKKSQEITDTMQIALKPAIEKAKWIEHFVKSNFNWNGHYDKYSTKSVKEFITTQTGNCADINLFLTGMLNAAGIEAYPVILSTRDHGRVKLDYPFLHFFNYVAVVARIDSLSYILDATEPAARFNEIPSRCINNKGLIIQKDKVEWVSLKSNSLSAIAYNIGLNPEPGKDSIQQECRLITSGFDAIYYRNKFSGSYKDLKNDLLGFNSLPGDTIMPLDLIKIEKPFEVHFSKKSLLETLEGKIIITPFGSFPITENPLKQPSRNYPIDLIYKKSFRFQSTIVIPEGYKILSAPEDMRVNNNNVMISYITDSQTSGIIKVTGVYEFFKDEYESSEYSELKSYFNMIVNKFNEKLVLVKI